MGDKSEYIANQQAVAQFEEAKNGPQRAAQPRVAASAIQGAIKVLHREGADTPCGSRSAAIASSYGFSLVPPLFRRCDRLQRTRRHGLLAPFQGYRE